jgi:serine/threonine protein kinase
MGATFRYKPGQIVPGTDLKVVRPIASGGMGSVYEVEETSVEAPFVMKVLHAHLLLDASSRMGERMRQEARTQARLTHKNIVRVYRAGVTAESPPLPYYVMDPLFGYTLRHVIRWHRSKGLALPLSWVFWIASGLLSALEYAHQHGVVHRDVKPDNIFIHHPEGHRPVVKLLDFGIMAAAAAELSNEARLTGKGRFAGTYTHAAPEQLRGEAPAPAMDLYAVGVVLYEILAGVHPFDDCKGPDKLADAHLHRTPRPISSRREVHPKLEALVASLLAKSPKDRPSSAREVLNSLVRIKTEWMQHTTDVSLNDPTEFHFDIGERWPTNVDAEDGFSVGSRADEKRSSPSGPLRLPAELQRLEPAEIPMPSDPAGASVSSRAWGQTLDRRKRRPTTASTLIWGSTSLLVAIVAIVAVWKALSRTNAAGDRAAATPTGNIAPAPMPNTAESKSTFPVSTEATVTFPQPASPGPSATTDVRRNSMPVVRIASAAPKVPPAPRSDTGLIGHASLAKPALQDQAPTVVPQPISPPPSHLDDDLLHP